MVEFINRYVSIQKEGSTYGSVGAGGGEEEVGGLPLYRHVQFGVAAVLRGERGDARRGVQG